MHRTELHIHWLLKLSHFILYFIFIFYPIFLLFQFSYLFLCTYVYTHRQTHTHTFPQFLLKIGNEDDYIGNIYWSRVYLPFFLNVGNLYSGSGKIGTLNIIVFYNMILLYCINIKLYLEQVKINVRIIKMIILMFSSCW